MPAEAQALCAVPFAYGYPNVTEVYLDEFVNASTCADWAAFRGCTAWVMDNEYLFDLASKGRCFVYATPFVPADEVADDDDNGDDDYWVYCDRQAITSPTGAPTTTAPTWTGASFSPTVSPTVRAADFGEEANTLCAAGLQIGNYPAAEVAESLFLSNLTAAECAAAVEAIANATAWFLDNEYLVDLAMRGCPYAHNCSNSTFCRYVTQPFETSALDDDDTLNGDYWVFCDLQTTDGPGRRSLTDMIAKTEGRTDNGHSFGGGGLDDDDEEGRQSVGLDSDDAAIFQGRSRFPPPPY